MSGALVTRTADIVCRVPGSAKVLGSGPVVQIRHSRGRPELCGVTLNQGEKLALQRSTILFRAFAQDLDDAIGHVLD